MMRTMLAIFVAVLLLGDLAVRALPVDNEEADAFLDQLLGANMVERRSHKQVTGSCISKCVSCAKYTGMFADKCIRGCVSKPAKGSINNAEYDAWSACEQFLYR